MHPLTIVGIVLASYLGGVAISYVISPIIYKQIGWDLRGYDTPGAILTSFLWFIFLPIVLFWYMLSTPIALLKRAHESIRHYVSYEATRARQKKKEEAKEKKTRVVVEDPISDESDKERFDQELVSYQLDQLARTSKT